MIAIILIFFFLQEQPAANPAWVPNVLDWMLKIGIGAVVVELLRRVPIGKQDKATLHKTESEVKSADVDRELKLQKQLMETQDNLTKYIREFQEKTHAIIELEDEASDLRETVRKCEEGKIEKREMCIHVKGVLTRVEAFLAEQKGPEHLMKDLQETLKQLAKFAPDSVK